MLVVIYAACGECVSEVVVDFGVAKVESDSEIGAFRSNSCQQSEVLWKKNGQVVGVNFVDEMSCVAMMGVILFASINIVAILLLA